MSGVESLLGDAKPFLGKVFSELDKDRIDVSGFELDHICYRVENRGRYTYLKEKLSEFGTLISEKMVNGRMISNFRLKDPIKFRRRDIWIVEIPSPKDGAFYNEGYEHVEFAVKMHPLEFAKLYPKVKFDVSGSEKKINPDVAIKRGNIQIKFHEHSLEYVIKNME